MENGGWKGENEEWKGGKGRLEECKMKSETVEEEVCKGGRTRKGKG